MSQGGEDRGRGRTTTGRVNYLTATVTAEAIIGSAAPWFLESRWSPSHCQGLEGGAIRASCPNRKEFTHAKA